MPRLTPTLNSFKWEVVTGMSLTPLTKTLMMMVPVMTFHRWSQNSQQTTSEHTSHPLSTPQPHYHR